MHTALMTLFDRHGSTEMHMGSGVSETTATAATTAVLTSTVTIHTVTTCTNSHQTQTILSNKKAMLSQGNRAMPL